MAVRSRFVPFFTKRKRLVFILSLFILILGFVLLSAESLKSNNGVILSIMTMYVAPVVIILGYSGMSYSILSTSYPVYEKKKVQ